MVRPEARDIKILETIVVVITDRHAHAKSDVSDACPVRYIRKGSIPIIMIERAFGLLMGFGKLHR